MMGGDERRISFIQNHSSSAKGTEIIRKHDERKRENFTFYVRKPNHSSLPALAPCACGYRVTGLLELGVAVQTTTVGWAWYRERSPFRFRFRSHRNIIIIISSSSSSSSRSSSSRSRAGDIYHKGPRW
jgi:hypothetical protein